MRRDYHVFQYMYLVYIQIDTVGVCESSSSNIASPWVLVGEPEHFAFQQTTVQSSGLGRNLPTETANWPLTLYRSLPIKLTAKRHDIKDNVYSLTL